MIYNARHTLRTLWYPNQTGCMKTAKMKYALLRIKAKREWKKH